MNPKVAAALQLGPMGLVRRARWRSTQGMRMMRSRVVSDRDCEVFVAEAASVLGGLPLRSFLPAPNDVRSCYARLGKAGEASAARIADIAAEVAEGRVRLRGIGELKLCFEVSNWYAYESTDAIMVNRHDFLLPLVQHYILTGSDSSRDQIRELFTYWIGNFDAGALVRCDTPIDAAIRLINWLWVLNCDVLDLDDEARAKLAEVIYQQLDYIHCRFSAGGNHLVLEALALYLYGGLFRATASGARWLGWAERTLLAELFRQTTSDGVHTEQSMFYHQAVTTHFLKYFLGAHNYGEAPGKSAADRLRLMLDYVHTTAMPDGSHPVVGDGEALVTADREHWEARSLYAARWSLFELPVDATLANTIDDSSIWLLGVPATEVSIAHDSLESTMYRDSGLAVFRDGDAYVFMDAAPFSDPEFPHHGHADALSFVACAEDAPILIDPGGYGYYDDDYRRFFRSTAAHNTIEIDGESQSRLFGVLGYGRLAQTLIEDAHLSDTFDYLLASHDGYGTVRHTRALFLCKHPRRAIVVHDRLTGKGGHRGISRFHAAPGVTININKNQLFIVNSSAEFFFAVAASQDLDRRVVNGQKNGNVQGWVSPETRRVVAADTLEFEFDMTGDFELLTAIALENGEEISVQLEPGRCAAVSMGGCEYSLTGAKGAASLTISQP